MTDKKIYRASIWWKISSEAYIYADSKSEADAIAIKLADSENIALCGHDDMTGYIVDHIEIIDGADASDKANAEENADALAELEEDGDEEELPTAGMYLGTREDKEENH